MSNMGDQNSSETRSQNTTGEHSQNNINLKMSAVPVSKKATVMTDSNNPNFPSKLLHLSYGPRRLNI